MFIIGNIQKLFVKQVFVFVFFFSNKQTKKKIKIEFGKVGDYNFFFELYNTIIRVTDITNILFSLILSLIECTVV